MDYVKVGNVVTLYAITRTGDIMKLTDNTIGIENNNMEIPVNFSLSQNFPNPFNPTTTINYTLPKNSEVKLTVYDALGCKIETLINKNQLPGNYKVTFDASQYPSGVYFYRLTTDGFSETKKMILIK